MGTQLLMVSMTFFNYRKIVFVMIVSDCANESISIRRSVTPPKADTTLQ